MLEAAGASPKQLVSVRAGVPRPRLFESSGDKNRRAPTPGERDSSPRQVRVYIADIDNWPAFNAMYARFCEDHKPARAVVPVPHLHYGLALEIEATAAL